MGPWSNTSLLLLQNVIPTGSAIIVGLMGVTKTDSVCDAGLRLCLSCYHHHG